MTNTVYPPDHLLKKWESLIIDEEENVDVVLYEAFQAGADQELEACCKILRGEFNYHHLVEPLRAARRPKPLSLKAQALCHLESFAGSLETLGMDSDLIRRAIESLPD